MNFYIFLFHSYIKVSFLYEQWFDWPNCSIDTNTKIAFFDDWLYTSHHWVRACCCSKNHSFRRHEKIATTKKYDGVYHTWQKNWPLLHFHFEHHSRRGWSYPGLFLFFFKMNFHRILKSRRNTSSDIGIFLIGTQIIATNSGTQTDSIHSMGTCKHSSGVVPKISICAKYSSCLRINVGQSHLNRFIIPKSFERLWQNETSQCLHWTIS